MTGSRRGVVWGPVARKTAGPAAAGGRSGCVRGAAVVAVQVSGAWLSAATGAEAAT
jgi:hypothetical protein